MKCYILKRKQYCYVLLVALFMLLQSINYAQYSVNSWDNFNDGKLPQDLSFKLLANSSNTIVFDIKSSNAPAGISDGTAQTECGPNVLKFAATETAPQLSVVNQSVLDRTALQESGKALLQADFFLTGKKDDCYSMAVQAIDPSQSGKQYANKLYRLGILHGDSLFFSFMNTGKEPAIFETQKLSDFNLKIPGWHRIQFIFEGKEKIICAIDQKPASFSPIIENTFTQLQPGIMVTANKTQTPVLTSTAYADNLSIQLSMEKDSPLPSSPWSIPDQAAETRPANSTPQPAANSSSQQIPFTTATSTGWLVSSEAAWKDCQTFNKPILVFFYAPHLPKYQEIDAFFKSSDQAKNVLKNYILLGLDANQLAGGREVKNFNVYKLPTFIVIGVDGKEKSRLIVSKQMSMQEILNKISGQ